jgi:hypothetical protein
VRWLRQWLIRLTTSMTRRHDESRVREEIDDYIAFETEANLRRGLSPAEARRRALLTFGSLETFKESCRDQQGLPALEHLLQDVRIALRRMAKTPGFTVAAIATLALGLGLTSAVMSLAYALCMPRSRSPSASGHARLRCGWRSAPHGPTSPVSSSAAAWPSCCSASSPALWRASSPAPSSPTCFTA